MVSFEEAGRRGGRGLREAMRKKNGARNERMRRIWAEGIVSQAELGREYNLTQPTVSKCISMAREALDSKA